MKSIAIEILKGKQLVSHLSELAKLRLTVFREYPYLYEGNLDFEKHYLSLFANSKDAFLAIAKDGNKVIAAISGLPLDCAQKEIRNAFTHYPMSTKEIFALCEIVVLKEYRSQKVGTLLYREFETHLAHSHYKKIALWQVIKSQNDPKKPADYFSLDRFWKKHGFVKSPSLHCSLSWKEIEDARETPKTFEFFIKDL